MPVLVTRHMSLVTSSKIGKTTDVEILQRTFDRMK